MSSGVDVVTLALRRRDVLDVLRVPREKRELAAELDVSRSTVDRAVRELEVSGLIRRIDGSYRLTPVGATVIEAIETLIAIGDGAAAVADVLGSIPDGISLPPSLLAEGTVESADGAPHRLPPVVRRWIETADEIAMTVPSETTAAHLACCRELSDASLDVVVESSLVDELIEQLPGIARWLAATDRARPLAGDVPPVAIVVARTDDEIVALVVGHDRQGHVTGCIESRASASVEWARTLVDGAIEAADPWPVDGHVGATDTPAIDDALASEGIVELTPSYFAAREAAPLSTGWRAGLAIAEVAAGYAVERTTETDGRRRRLTDEILDRLRERVDVAVVGPPGSGKSTVCKAVAYEWYREQGPVFYRESGQEPFESWPALAERLRSIDGHPLVVVEDAVRPEASAVFRLIQAFSSEDVTFLLDARENEWSEPSTDELPGDFRVGVDVVAMPTLDERDTERFLDRFEADVGGVDVSASALLDDVESTADRPARLLCVLYRLSLLADPLADGESTSLDDAVRELAAELETAGGVAFDAGLLVNLCNVAGVEVTSDLVATLAPGDPDVVRDALDRLEGRVLFADPTGDGYRTVHEAWSGQYLRALAERDDIAERVGRCLSRLLAIADDADVRRRITAAFDPAPTVERVEADPEAWAEATLERLFEVGLERPALSRLFGESDPDPVTFPDVCSPETIVEVMEMRARMARYAGEFDRAEREYERLSERATTLLDPEAATRYAARRENGLGNVARKRSAYETAADHYERAEELYETLGDEHGVADARKNIGTVALLEGDLDRAEAHLEWSYERLRELGDDRLANYSQFNLASIHEERGDLDGAIDRYRECLDYYRQHGMISDEADVHLNLGVALKIRGDVEAASDHYASALRIYREVGETIGVANALQNHGEIALERGALDDATEYFEQSRSRYEEIGEEWGQVQCQVALAEIALERDALGDAETAATDALRRLEDIGDSRGTMDARRIIADVARERDEFDRAETHLEAAVETGWSGGYSHRTGRLLAAYGDLEHTRERPVCARRRYREAVELLEDAGALGELVETLSKLADASEAAGDEAAAEAHRTRAEELAEKVAFDLSVTAD